MAKAFNPDINGFTINAVKTLFGTDGYITRCNLLFNGKKVGEYFDPADGGPYDFTAANGFNAVAVERTVAAFPAFERDFGMGKEFSKVRWDIGILVDELLRLKDLSKVMSKTLAIGREMVVVSCWERNAEWSVQIPEGQTDRQIDAGIGKLMAGKKLPKYEWKRCSIPENLCIRNSEVKESSLR